jgi:hypothetical protein
VPELVAAHLADDVAVAIDQLGATHLRTRLDDRVMRIHPAQDVKRRPAHVDLVPTRRQRCRSLDDGRVEAVAAKPVPRHRSGDARSRDQDVHRLPD